MASLPWEGIVKLVLTGLGIVVSVIAVSPSVQSQQADSEYVSNIRYATIYLFFAVSGLMDILVYYCGYDVLPEGVQSFILSLAFVVEGLTFAMRLRFEGYLEQQIHVLLVVAVFSCAVASIMEVRKGNTVGDQVWRVSYGRKIQLHDRACLFMRLLGRAGLKLIRRAHIPAYDL